MPVLAEGVETADQLELLNMVGCEQAQGYLIGRPAPGREWRAARRAGCDVATG
jgi:EAL domain-containing protein (putative c-di-GMP-specific phosphodiesterase class I)